MRPLLEQHGSLDDWTAFAASWADLDLDTYMADGGRYRRRRHAAFAARRGDTPIVRQPHQPHFQTRDYNPLHGGIERWFAPVRAEIADGASMQTILRFCRALFDGLMPDADWHIEVHQFRIEPPPTGEGRPTPEGMHRDGVDYVLVLMIERTNIASGETSIHDLEGGKLGSFTLTDPLDAALVHDRRVYHGVTPVVPLDPSQRAHRDVLVVTFRAE
ncbi:MAG: 2OG-Fe dioxygenase family protein [Alphaproteobacteria bacterium]|nr:2OG-Fe dioxygenase family protein [Alphaproteobacteria bacterium]